MSIEPSPVPTDNLGERVTGVIGHVVSTKTMKGGTLQLTIEVERPSHWDSLILTERQDELLYFDVHEYVMGGDDIDWDEVLGDMQW